MRVVRILLTVCGLFTTMPAWAGMSGTYVGKGLNLAIMIQIVETGGGSFTGRYEQVVLQADGKMEEMNATIAGVRDGGTVVAIIRGADLFAASVPVSGTYQGGAFHLTGGAGLVLNLLSADEPGFRAQVAALNGRAGEIRGARAEAAANEREVKLEGGSAFAASKSDGPDDRVQHEGQWDVAEVRSRRATMAHDYRENAWGSGPAAIHLWRLAGSGRTKQDRRGVGRSSHRGQPDFTSARRPRIRPSISTRAN